MLSDSFVRLWEFYLCYCEGGFIERALGDVHNSSRQIRMQKAAHTRLRLID
jgi:hypothetical protein